MLYFNSIWNIFFTLFFLEATLTLIIKLYKPFSIKYNLKQNITLFSSIAHVFLLFSQLKW